MPDLGHADAPCPELSQPAIDVVRVERGLVQLQHLVDDAAAMLCRGFHEMQALASRHAALTRRCLGVHNADAHEELACITAAVEREVGSAVTALQFQDMASQIIAHAQAGLGEAAGEGGGRAPAGPVAARAMTPGDVELF
jgi:hypothetical protein